MALLEFDVLDPVTMEIDKRRGNELVVVKGLKEVEG